MSQQQNKPIWRAALPSIVAFDWLILILLLPLILFPRPATYIALLLIPLTWFMRRVTAGHFVLPTPSDLAVLSLLIMVLVSLFVTFDIALSAPRVAGLIYGIAVYYSAAAATGRTSRALTAGVGFLLACGLIVATLALVGTRWPTKLSFLVPFTAKLPHLLIFPAAPQGFSANQVAGILLFVLPLFVALTLTGLNETHSIRNGSARLRWLVAILLGSSLIVTGTFLLTQSRSGYLGLAAALLFMILAGRRYHRLVLIGGVPASLLLAFGFALLIGLEAAPDNFSSLPGDMILEPPESLSVTETVNGRLEIWTLAQYGLEDFPLTGIGIGTFRRLAPLLYPTFLVSPDQDIAHAHNQLLQTGLDLGLPGLIAYLALWILAGAMLWRCWYLRQDVWHCALVIGFAGALIGQFVYGLTDALALGAKPGFIFWLLLGLIAGMHHLSTRSSPAIN